MRIRKKKELTAIPVDIITALAPILAEGLIFSFRHVKYSRTKIEVPAWVVGDYLNMDEMYDDFSDRKIKEPDVFITFNRKEKVWESVIKNTTHSHNTSKVDLGYIEGIFCTLDIYEVFRCKTYYPMHKVINGLYYHWKSHQ